MATPRKRTAKRAPAKRRTNSNIQSAQRASVEKRTDRAKASAETGRPDDVKKAQDSQKLKAAQEFVDPRRPRQPTLEQNLKGGGTTQGADPGKSVTGLGPAANKIAGLASGIMDQRQAEAAKLNGPPRDTKKLADASLYGSSNNAARATRLDALLTAQTQKANQVLMKGGKAVYMGKQAIKIRNTGPERLDPEGNGSSTTTEHAGDDIKSSDELMSWLADEKTFNQIRDAAKKAGMDVQSYDDVAKIWQQVVAQAASTYSTTGKKVTPWDLLTLRGKSMVNGKPAAKTTTSTSVEDMDPAQAKVMLKNSLSQMLGRDPRQDEIDDFISKAQMLAKQNPNVTTTTTQYDVTGSPTSQSSTSHGGSDVVSAKAQLEAEQMAKEAPDYAQYQAAGVMMPWLNEALASPF